ncbi:cyclodeaminase/cyclohydrolase family protein [Candidatus Omnitrophota bacterium]
MYRNQSIKKYLDDLAARLPAPGGGSAAALNAALGVCLISMVINFTLGKPKYAKYQAGLVKALSAAEKIRKRLLELVDLDVAAFRSKNINKSLGVPLEISRLCFEALKLCPPLIKKGNRNLISDVAVAAILIEAGFSSALFNVRINLRYLKNKKLSSRLSRGLDKNRVKIIRMRGNLEAKIDEIIRG